MAEFTTSKLGDFYHQPQPLPPPTDEPKRELLIFAIYVEIGTQSEAKARERLMEMQKMYSHTFKEIESQTNYLIKSFILPIKDGNTRIECIFSGSNTKTGPANMEKLLGDMEEKPKGFTVGAKKSKIDSEWESGSERLSDYSNIISRQTLYE